MYSASRVLRAWSRHPSLLAGQAAVRAAEACGLVQLGAVAAAAAVAYVQDLRRRKDWLERTAAERKQATICEAAGHVDGKAAGRCVKPCCGAAFKGSGMHHYHLST